MYSDTLNAFADLFTSPPSVVPTIDQLKLRFIEQVPPALKDAGRAILRAHVEMLRVGKLYSAFNAAGLVVECPAIFHVDPAMVVKLARDLIKLGMVELSDPILHEIELG